MKKTVKNTISEQTGYIGIERKRAVTIPMDIRFSDMDANGHVFLVIISLFLIRPFLNTLT